MSHKFPLLPGVVLGADSLIVALHFLDAMRLYVHCCDSRFALTHVARIADDIAAKFSAVIVSFLTEFNAQHADGRTALNLADVFGCDKSGVELQTSLTLDRLKLGDRDDVFVYFRPSGVRKLFGPPNAIAIPETSDNVEHVEQVEKVEKVETTSKAEKVQKAEPSVRLTAPPAWAFASPATMAAAADQCSAISSSIAPSIVQRSVETARSLLAGRHIRRARDLLEMVLYLDPNCIDALEMVGTIRIDLHLYHAAVDPLKHMVDLMQSTFDSLNIEQQVRFAQTLFRLGQCQANIFLDEWYKPPAVRSFSMSESNAANTTSCPWPPNCLQCTAVIAGCSPALQQRFEALVEQVYSDKRACRQLSLRTFEQVNVALKSIAARINSQSKSKSHESTLQIIADLSDQVLLWTARSLAAQHCLGIQPTHSETSSALVILESLVDRRGDMASALLEYAVFAYDRGKVVESVPILLKALVAKSPDDSVRRRLGFVVESLSTKADPKAGIRVMLNEMKDALKSPAALAFLAQAFKDVGYVIPSLDLYAQTVDVLKSTQGPTHPQVINMSLTLAHMYEVCAQFQTGVDQIKAALSLHPNATITANGNTLKVQQVLDVLNCFSDITDPALRTGTVKNLPIRPVAILQDAGKCSSAPPKLGSSGIAAPAPKEEKPCAILPLELDLLGLMMVSVKMLYGVGALQPLPALIELIEPVRVYQNLHTTSIRNEHAYYQEAAQLMFYISFPVPLTREVSLNHNNKMPSEQCLRPIYLCGDSHCYSTAWHTLEYPRGERRVIVPKLVTGLKCYHMRADAAFFPKSNLHMMLQTIPRGSDVVFAFGEIDCREGLLVSADRARYESVDEGINATVDTYYHSLAACQSQYGFNVFVHPVVPVMDITRAIVRKFNAALQQRYASRSWPFRLLDFFDGLLAAPAPGADPSVDPGYKKEYELDGTHLNPMYVPLMEQAFNADAQT